MVFDASNSETLGVGYGAPHTAGANDSRTWTYFAWPPHGYLLELGKEDLDRLEQAQQRVQRLMESAVSSVNQTVTIRDSGKPAKEGSQSMKAVFNVLVVSKKGEILLDKKVVAKDRDEALFEADVSAVLKAKGLKPGDVTMLCVKIGDVEIEPEPQKVQIVEKGS